MGASSWQLVVETKGTRIYWKVGESRVFAQVCPAVSETNPPPAAPRYSIVARLRSQQVQLLIRYGFAAAIATAWDAIWFGQLYQVVFASETVTKLLTYSTGVILHFYLAKWFVFTGHKSTEARTQFVRFVGVAVLVLALNVFAIKGFLAWLQGTETAVWLGQKLFNTLVSGAAAVTVGFGSFTLNRLYTFR